MTVYKMRAKINDLPLDRDGVWLNFTHFDEAPPVPLPGEHVELYDTSWGNLWVGRIDTVNYLDKRLFVTCDWNERIPE